MPPLKTELHERFAQARARGLTQTDSAREAGYAAGTEARRGLELNRRPDVQARVAEIQARIDTVAATRVVASREWVLKSLLEVAEDARSAKDRASRIRSLELVGKELGMFVHRTQEVKSPLDDMSPSELMALIATVDRVNGHVQAAIDSAPPVLELEANAHDDEASAI